MRGDVYRLRAARAPQEHEQRAPRYAVVVRSDRLPLSTLLVAPTSTSAAPAVFRPQIMMDGTRTSVLVEHATAVNVEARPGDVAGRLDQTEMAEIDQALTLVLGLL